MPARSVWCAMALIVGGAAAAAGQTASRRLYFVPGIHYDTPSRASVALTAFLDGRKGVVGQGNIFSVQAGRDALKAQLGIANTTHSLFNYSVQVGYLQTRARPIEAMPNAQYAGTEFHLYIGVVNLGTGFYAPVGSVTGRKGLLHLGAGVGF